MTAALLLTVLVLILLLLELSTQYDVWLSQTPHDRELTASRRSRCPFSPKAYHFFLSYKSEDAMLARHVCEALAASGYYVWFAEYVILLYNQNEFQQAIDVGVSQSRFTLALTNKLYTRSLHCRNELQELLKPKNCGPERTIELRNPGDPELYKCFPSLREAHQTDFRDFAETIEAIGKTTKLRIARKVLERRVLLDSTGRRETYRHAGVVYSLDAGPWRESLKGDVELGGKAARANQWFFLDSSVGRVWVAVLVETRSETPRERDLAPVDQKAYYSELLRENEQKYGAISTIPRPLECLGVHLYRLYDLTHPAFTCYKAPRWTREYSIVLPDEQNLQNICFEFIFSFGSSFMEFARVAWLFDRFVMSLRLERQELGP